MWQKILTLLAQVLLIPLIKDFIAYIQKRIESDRRYKEKKEQNAESARKLEEAKTDQEKEDAFKDMP